MHWAPVGTRAKTLRRECRFCVGGYGKMGGKELGYGSDLDVIFPHDEPRPPIREAARVAQRCNLDEHPHGGGVSTKPLRCARWLAGLMGTRSARFATTRERRGRGSTRRSRGRELRGILNSGALSAAHDIWRSLRCRQGLAESWRCARSEGRE